MKNGKLTSLASVIRGKKHTEYMFVGLGRPKSINSQFGCTNACKYARDKILDKITDLYFKVEDENMPENDLSKSLEKGLRYMSTIDKASVDVFLLNLKSHTSLYFTEIANNLGETETEIFIDCFNHVAGNFYLSYYKDPKLAAKTKTAREMPDIDERLSRFGVQAEEAEDELYRIIDNVAIRNGVKSNLLREAVDLELCAEQMHAIHDISMENGFSPKFGTFGRTLRILKKRSYTLFDNYILPRSKEDEMSSPEIDQELNIQAFGMDF